MASQGRLAFSRLRVPNLDGAVATAAGNLLSIWAPRHRADPVIVIVTTPINRKKGKKNPKKLTNPSARSKKNLHSRVPGHRALAKVHDEIIYILMFFEHWFLKKSHIFKWPVSQILRKKHECVVNFISHWLKKLTLPIARSPFTRKRTG